MARPPKSAFGHRVAKAFGTLLKEYRTKARLPVQKLATKSGVDRKYIYQLEKGTSQPTLEILFRLTAALDLDSTKIVTKIRSRLARTSRKANPRRPSQ